MKKLFPPRRAADLHRGGGPDGRPDRCRSGGVQGSVPHLGRDADGTGLDLVVYRIQGQFSSLQTVPVHLWGLRHPHPGWRIYRDEIKAKNLITYVFWI